MEDEKIEEEEILCEDCVMNAMSATHKCPDCGGFVCERHARFSGGYCPFYAKHSPKLERL